MKNLKSFVAAFLCLTLSAQTGLAACDTPALQSASRFSKKLNLDAYSVYELRSHDMRGEDQRRPTILASISKIFVTHWALAALPGGHTFRFPMEIFIIPTPQGNRIHIAGHNYPYFDGAKMDSIFSELKRRGVTNISEVTFDEKAKFIRDKRMAMIGDLPLAYPSQESIASNIASYKRESKVAKFKSFRIIHSSNFIYDTKTMQRIVTQSEPLLKILKKMNDESNNHIANRIFQYLGGQGAYARFVWEAYGCGGKSCSPDQVSFYNGSGNPVVEPGPGAMKSSLGHYTLAHGQKIYNKAPSGVVVQALAYIYTYMTNPSLHLKLSDIMSIAEQGEHNHLTRYTNKCYLEGNIVAKTGSVFEAIALAGFLSTKERGPLAFYFNIDTENKSDWGPAKQEISAYLTGITRLYGQGPNFN